LGSLRFRIFLVLALLAAGPGNPFLRAGEEKGGEDRSLEESSLRFQARFEQEIWPLFQAHGGKSCLSCHTEEGMTPLLLFDDPRAAFRSLLTGDEFDPENSNGLLARLTSPDPKFRMPPPPSAPVEEKTLATLRRFLTDVYQLQIEKKDEAGRRFPEALLLPWSPAPERAPPPGDNTFLTYTQLRGKIVSIFGDDWQRGEKDLFQENLAQFGGADFRRSFNESTKASATFLSALDRLAADVSSRAYLEGSGPFAGLPGKLPEPPPPAAPAAGEKGPAPRESLEPDPATAAAIEHLYRRILFREPSPGELRSSFSYLSAIYGSAEPVRRQDYELTFELIVRGEEGISTTRGFTIPVEADPHPLHLEWVAQSQGEEGDQGNSLRNPLGTFFFRAKDQGPAFRLLNRDTQGAVTFHALWIRGPLPDPAAAGAANAPLPAAPGEREAPVRKVVAGDRSIRLLGAWSSGERGGVKFLSDGDHNKGESELTVPITVKEDGLYQVVFVWRKPKDEAAPAVAVEVTSSSGRSSLGLQPPPRRPEKRGEASFLLDQTLDSIAFQDLHTSFRFGPEGHLEIRNAGTTRRVVADAVRFQPAAVPVGSRRGDTAGAGTFLIDNDEAEGREGWSVFNPGMFKPYNVTGKDTITDENKKKGELWLRYRPSSKPAWKRELFYQVSVGFPGKEGNETQAPVTVRAEASSPIVTLRYPYRARIGAEVVLDASGSYDLQAGKLTFLWSQRGGPRVELKDRASARLSFQAPERELAQEAWAGLARSLLKHPDFLFTRPVSLERTMEPPERRRLLLVKAAADLVARAPSAAELEALERGESLEEAVDRYLESEEFRAFYFHRVRLYLESDGTEEGDEPVRLWCYVAFNDRPFQEILTADYTVDSSLQRQPRPACHGKTGLLTMPGFIKGKPGLPHFNYAAHVAEKLLGYVFEVPPEIVAMRDGITAISTTSPGSVCYSCHKVLTPLAFQRSRWDDQGRRLEKDADGKEIDDTDRGLVLSYPFRGRGMEGFAERAQTTERFIRTMINAHFIWLFGREMRYEADERALYKRLWDRLHDDGFKLKGLIRALVASPEYGAALTSAPGSPARGRKGGSL
jgi:hypothetical protein